MLYSLKPVKVRIIKPLVSVIITMAVLLLSSTGNIYASNESDITGSIPLDSNFSRENNYFNYRNTYRETPLIKDKITIKASGFLPDSTAAISELSSIGDKKDVVIIESSGGKLDYRFTVMETGLYNIHVNYYAMEGYRADIEIGIKLNGEYPFNEARNITFPRIWKDERKIIQDNRGNDIRPTQIANTVWQNNIVKNEEGLYNEAYLFYLVEGENILSFEIEREGFALDLIEFYGIDEEPAYEEVASGYKELTIEDFFFKRQAEEAYLKSAPQLIPGYDRSSPATEPSSPSNLKLNTIGGHNWDMPGQWISWQVEVDRDGLYEIGFKYRQNIVRGFFTTRRIYINDKVPFVEMNDVRFNFSNQWETLVLGGNNPYLFYLEEGINEIKLEVTIGEMADTLRRLEDVVFELNELYRKIIMITGTNPDIYRDYFLEREIPGFIDTLERNSEILKDEVEKMEILTGEKGTEASQLEGISFQLDSIIRRPESMKERLDNFKSNVSILASWILRIKEQPLELDYIFVKSPDVKAPSPKAGFFQNISYHVKSFFASFVVDYSSVGDVYEDTSTLRVWIYGGRDQASIAKNMIDDLFTPVHKVPVNLELVQSGLIEAILSGVNPDVIMNVGRGDPVNLAARNALTGLKDMPGYDDVITRFTEQATIPFTYAGDCYALPVQQDFNVMFYRADILSELEIELPQTWDDFYKVIPKIQRANMQIGIPSGGVVAQPNMPAGYDIFATLLLQRDKNFYNTNRTRTMFDEIDAIESFGEWTSFFADYSFPIQFDFYNRFRTGEMPLAIQSYSQYNMLMVGAPEIRNLWGIAPIPGTLQADGSINRSIPGGSSAAIILQKSEMQKQSWEFIKWWTDSEAQLRYGTELETIMGAAARYNTANTKALQLLPWSSSELEVLMIQRSFLKEIPEIPASYYITRNLNNAFRAAVYNYNTNPREVLFEYNTLMNNEIERKNNELGYVGEED